MNCHISCDSAAQRRADRKMRDPDQEHRAPAEEVGQLPVDRAADAVAVSRYAGEGPDVDVVALQVGDDARQGGAHDRLVQGGEEDAQQDGAQDLHPDAVGQLDGGSVEGRLVWRGDGHARRTPVVV